MNANFTRKPTKREVASARDVSEHARTLVAEYANEVSDAREWPNRENVQNTRIALLAYISDLERNRP
jgi:hypothetical protein